LSSGRVEKVEEIGELEIGPLQDLRSPMVDGRWSMVDGRWSMVDGRCLVGEQNKEMLLLMLIVYK
jgi:hypothetical protein